MSAVAEYCGFRGSASKRTPEEQTREGTFFEGKRSVLSGTRLRMINNYNIL
jgi:hypothetical protein